MKTFALFHPGEMGAALGAALASRGFCVLWASQGRSAQTVARARAASLEDTGTIGQAIGDIPIIAECYTEEEMREMGVVHIPLN